MNMRQVKRSKLKKVVSEVNDALGYINTETITDTNKLLNAAVKVVEKRLGIKRRTTQCKEPWWKRGIQQKIKSLRRDISRFDRITAGN